MPPELLIAASRLSPAASSIVVFLLGGLVFAVVLTIAATLLSWHLQRARLARESVRTEKPPVAGPAVIAGTVSLEDASPYAVRVEIFQHGKEWQSKGAWYTTWKETSRRIDSRPFHLVTASGARIRVEPGQDVFLVDALDRETHPTQEERVMAAELSPGERVTISGVMVWARDPNVAPVSYRAQTGKALVLRPPRAEPMLISSEPLEARHLRHAKIHKRMVVITALAWVVFHAAAFGYYDLLSWFGDVEQARVERTTTWITRGKNSKTQHYGIEAKHRGADGNWREVDDEVSFEAYNHFRQNPDATVPFRVYEPLGIACVGMRPTIAKGTALFAVVVNLGLIIAYIAQARAALQWYERRRLVQTVPGRL